jgi:hypothetical protein
MITQTQYPHSVPSSRQPKVLTENWVLSTGYWLSIRIQGMANLTLVYGMRLLPSEDVAEVGQAPVKLSNGREAHVTMHVLEGSKEEIEKQLRTSLEAFFDLYPEI